MEKQAIYQALCDINKEVGVIKKEERNVSQKFNYRGIDMVMNELHNLFVTHEVFIIPTVTNSFREERESRSGGALIYSLLNIDFKFTAVDGSSVTASVIGEAMDSGDKSTNKAMSAGLKVALIELFLIPTAESKDPDGESHEMKSNAPVKPKAAEPKPSKKEQPTLTDGAVKKAIDRINAGEYKLAAKILKTYKLSMQQVKELEKATPQEVVAEEIPPEATAPEGGYSQAQEAEMLEVEAHAAEVNYQQNEAIQQNLINP